MNRYMFLLGMFGSIFFFEPILINFIYFSNIALFEDLILTKKNKNKLIEYHKERENVKN